VEVNLISVAPTDQVMDDGKEMTKLILNADDYGLAPGVNDGIRRLAVSNCISSISLMANMPWARGVVQLRVSVPDLGVGVHLNLTEGKPLSRGAEVRSLIDERGYFLPPSRLLRRTIRGRVSLKECRRELQRQITRALELTDGYIDHWNSHQGIHRFEPLLSVFLNVCREFGIRAMRAHKHYCITEKNRRGRLVSRRRKTTLKGRITELYYLWMRWRCGRCFFHPTGLIAVSDLPRLADMLQNDRGWEVCLETVCHPATTTEGLEEDHFNQVRLREFTMLSAPEIMQVITEIEKAGCLCTYRDLRGRQG
jgi:predicted glycoside hydrolase/deacetylase ChbG (UPF0249 family)